jgi:hypothetical protein
LLACAIAAPARGQDPKPTEAEPKKDEPAKPEEKPSDGGDKKRKSVALEVPGEWRAEKAKGPKSLKAAFRLEAADGDKDPAHATLWYFGEKGSVDKSVSVFAKMFGTTPDKVKKESLDVGGMKATTCEIAGSFTEAQGKKKDKAADPKPGYKLIAAIIEAPDGPWVARLVGPEKTVEKNRETFLKWVKSAHASDRADDADDKPHKKKSAGDAPKSDTPKGDDPKGDDKKGDDKKGDDKKGDDKKGDDGMMGGG